MLILELQMGNIPSLPVHKNQLKHLLSHLTVQLLAGNGDFNVKLYRGKFEAYQRTYVLSPYCAQHLYLLYYTISANMTKLAAGSSGSTIKFLTKGMIDGINLNIPNDEILRSFNKKIEPIQSSREFLQSQLRLLTEARDRLLPKLMSGEITV